MSTSTARSSAARADLLQAARVVMRRDGLASLSTRSVATEAGAPLSQIHYHFGSKQGLLLDREADLLAGIVELDEIRVREIMTPRVDTFMLDLSEDDPSELVARAVEAKVAWLVVTDGNPDRVAGRVRVRDLLTRPGTPYTELLEPVTFVPEVATALHLLEQLRERAVAVAVVVDEWGGTAGVVRIEDILEEVVGELRVEDEDDAPPVEDLGDGSFSVVGDLPVRDWNELFGTRVVPTEFETVGGLVTAMLGRIPRVGDEVHLGGLVFVVREVRRRRIVRLELRVQPPDEEVAE